MDVYNEYPTVYATQLYKDLAPCTNMSDTVRYHLLDLDINSERQNTYSKPMLWIGIYIGVASLFCILQIVADLLHGLKTKKLWFPCKYFTLNAASLTVIAVAMKLPMDLNNPMPGDVDQAAKLGSMSFMCTMMANLLPSLATMDSKVLLTNIIALVILVITVVVNVCIQIETGVVSSVYDYKTLAVIYVALLIALLLIYTCSALMILESKQLLESKYQDGHETASKDLELRQANARTISVEKLKQHVSKHWIMAGTGSPQFMSVCSATTSASGVICVASTALHLFLMFYTIQDLTYAYGSDYKWSVAVIFIIQSIGIILGTIAPLSRIFASLSFEVSLKWIWNHISVFKVESYFTQKLYDWKLNSVPFKFSSRRSRIIIHNLKVLILNLLIVFQKTVVVVCKITTLITIFFVTGVWCCLYCWKWLHVIFGASLKWLKVRLGASSSESVRNPAQLQHKDLSRYVLRLQDDMDLAERTLSSISKSVTRLIQTAEKQQPTNLMKLLEESSGFAGVGKYEMQCVPLIPEEDGVDCWSLAVVTLTTIAISLPNIQNNMVDRLLKSVCEGLTYVKHVEETLNASDEHVLIQKAARTLWLELEVYQKWLGNKLHAHQVNTSKEIVQWFDNTAFRKMITESGSKYMNTSDDSFRYKLVSANSMLRITQTILASDHANIDEVSQEDLFEHLSKVISNILAACLTNLPQVIAMKCHTNIIEKREESVHAAAQLLGETTQIINILQDRQLPSLDRDELPFIDKWRDWFLHPLP